MRWREIEHMPRKTPCLVWYAGGVYAVAKKTRQLGRDNVFVDANNPEVEIPKPQLFSEIDGPHKDNTELDKEIEW